MIEILFVLAIIIAIAVLFYRQAIDEYNILQIDAEKIAEIPKLLTERYPLVVKDAGVPKVFTAEVLRSNTRLRGFPLGKQKTLGTYLSGNNEKLQIPKEARKLLAAESGLHVWSVHSWFPRCFTNPLFENLHSVSTEGYVGTCGLRKCTAINTIIFPATGTLEVTLLTEKQSVFFPRKWKNTVPETWTIHDTPLIADVKYINIKLRPGNVLFVPTHWFVSVSSSESPLLWSFMEVHNPISYLASRLEDAV